MNLKLCCLILAFTVSCSLSYASNIVKSYSTDGRSAIQSSDYLKSRNSMRNTISDYEAVYSELTSKIEQNPQNYVLYTDLIEFFIKNGKYEQAFEELDFLNNISVQGKLDSVSLNNLKSLKQLILKNVRYSQHKSSLYLNLAMINLISGDISAAENAMIYAARRIENSDLFVATVNSVYNTTRNYEAGIDLTDNVLLQSPDNVPLRKLKALYLTQTDNIDKASAEYIKILALNPEDKDSIYNLYNILSSQKLSDKNLLKKMFSNKSVTEQNYYNLAEVLFEHNDIQGAQNYARQLVEKYPDNASGYLLLCEIYRKQGDLKDAYEVLQKARDKADDGQTVAKYNILLAKLSDQPVKEADSLMNNNMYEQALSVLQSADSENLYVILGMARANYFLDNKQTAFELLNKAMSFYPQNADVMYYFAFCFYMEKDYESARKYINETLRLEPQHSYGLKLLDTLNKAESDKFMSDISSAFERQDYESAMNFVDSAMAIYDKDATLYYYKALIYIAMNNYAAATAPLYKSLYLDGNNILCYFYLGLAFDNLSEKENALDNYKKFVENLPADDYGESEKLEYAKARIEKLSEI